MSGPSWRRLSQAGRNGSDVPAESILDPGHAMYPLLRHWCQLIYSKDPSELSTGDAANYSDSHVNLPVEDGYGALVARLSRGLPIRLGVTVKAIEVAGQGVRLETSSGTVTAKACILAVPSRMMEKQRIAIKPGLPAAVAAGLCGCDHGLWGKSGLGL